MSKNKQIRKFKKKIVSIVIPIATVVIVAGIIGLSVIYSGGYNWTECTDLDVFKGLLLQETSYYQTNAVEWKDSFTYTYKETIGEEVTTNTDGTEFEQESFKKIHSTNFIAQIIMKLQEIQSRSGNNIKGGYGSDGSFEFSVSRQIISTIADVYEISMTRNKNHYITSYTQKLIYNESHKYGEISWTLNV